MTRWFHFYHEHDNEGGGMYVPESSIARFYVAPDSAMFLELTNGRKYEVNLTIGQVESMLNEDDDGLIIEAHHYDEDGNPK